MASTSSQRPVTPKSGEKIDSFWDKFGTIGRNKKITEGRYKNESNLKSFIKLK